MPDARFCFYPAMKKIVLILFVLGLLLMMFMPRWARVGGISWWHITAPGSANSKCIVEVVSWQGETIYCRFFSSPVDVSVEHEGYLMLTTWRDGDPPRYYDVQERKFISWQELERRNPPEAPRPAFRPEDDWGLTNLYNIAGSEPFKVYWIQYVEKNLPRR